MLVRLGRSDLGWGCCKRDEVGTNKHRWPREWTPDRLSPGACGTRSNRGMAARSPAAGHGIQAESGGALGGVWKTPRTKR